MGVASASHWVGNRNEEGSFLMLISAPPPTPQPPLPSLLPFPLEPQGLPEEQEKAGWGGDLRAMVKAGYS